jgi:hypothetical protein
MDVRRDRRRAGALRYWRACQIRGAIDGEPFTGADGAERWHTQALGKAALRKTIGEDSGDIVHVRIDERIG